MYTKADLETTVHSRAFDKVSTATYRIPGTKLSIDYSRFGILIGTSRSKPFLFSGRGYSNLSQALEALNKSCAGVAA